MRTTVRFWPPIVLIPLSAGIILITAGPPLQRHIAVSTALTAMLTDGPDYKSGTTAESWAEHEQHMACLLSDQQNVTDRLMKIALANDSVGRRVNAIRIIYVLSSRSDSFAARRQFIPDIVTLACDSATPSALVIKAAELITVWTPSTGLTAEERSRIIHRAAASDGEERIAWIRVLDSIRGREEVELLLVLGETHDSKLLGAIHNSQFRFTRWTGMLPTVERWIQDPVIARTALEFFVLSRTPDGRAVLLKYVADDSRPMPLRAKAVEQLTQTMAGIDVLEAACSDDEMATLVSNLVNEDVRHHIQTLRLSMQNRLGHEFWNELIRGIDPSYWIPASGMNLPAEVETQYDLARKKHANQSLRCLQILTNHSEWTTQDEWQTWYHDASPGLVEQRTLLQLVIDHPELIELSTIYHRFVLYHAGSIPHDCLPLYYEMLRPENPSLQYHACRALLEFTDSAEAIDVAIELIDRTPPDHSLSIHNGATLMLQRRFAENYFWNTDAWRTWARKRRSAQHEQSTMR